MTQSNLRHLAALMSLAAIAATAGCKSGSGSRWAWNPFSRSGEAEQLVAESAPKLPTDGATPEIEGLQQAKGTPDAATLAKGETPPAVTAIASTMEAVAEAVPSIDKPAPTPGANPSGWNPYPSSPAANPTAAKPAPTAVASQSGGPYNPNGYNPQAVAAAGNPAGDRYGLGGRYASSTATPPEAANPFGDLPATPVAPAAVGDRYASAAPAATAAPPADSYSQTPLTPTSGAPMAPQAEAITPPPAAASPYPGAAVAATTPPAMPASQPRYPVAGATASSPSTIGSLPPETSVYASTPITPIEPATATEPSEGAGDGTVVRLTTVPGEYRPGGTSSYPSTSGSAPAATSRY